MAIKIDNDRTHAIYIALDEKRIIADNQDIDTIKNHIDDICTKNSMYLSEDGWYIDGTFETIGVIVIVLSKQEWFMDYIKEWYLYDRYEGSCEDLVSSYKKGVTRYVNFAPKQWK